MDVMSPDYRLDIVIVGAGLSGIGAAISCAIGGHSVKVLEAASQLSEVYTIPLLPNRSLLKVYPCLGGSWPSDHSQRVEDPPALEVTAFILGSRSGTDQARRAWLQWTGSCQGIFVQQEDQTEIRCSFH